MLQSLCFQKVNFLTVFSLSHFRKRSWTALKVCVTTCLGRPPPPSSAKTSWRKCFLWPLTSSLLLQWVSETAAVRLLCFSSLSVSFCSSHQPHMSLSLCRNQIRSARWSGCVPPRANRTRCSATLWTLPSRLRGQVKMSVQRNTQKEQHHIC